MAEQKTTKQRQVIRHGTETIQTYYSNNAELRGTQWDIRFTFGELIEVSEEKLEVRNLATVYMSPQHAKVFAATLIKNIQAYEQQFGPIVSTENFTIEIEADDPEPKD